MVPRFQAHRVPVAGLARREELGRAGAAHEGARRAEDDRAGVGQGADHATGTTSSTIARRTCTRSASTAASRRRSRSAPASRWRSPSPTRTPTTSRPTALEIAFASDTDRSGVEPNFDIYVLPVDRSAAPRNITADNPADDNAPQYSPDGRLLAFQRQVIQDFYADRARLMLFDRRGGKVRSLTEDWDRSADGLVWSPDSDALFGSIDDARHAAHLSLRRVRRRAARGHARAQLQLARDRRQRAGDRRPAPELHRAADAGQHHSAHRRRDQALRLQRRGARRISRRAASRASPTRARTATTCRCGSCIRRTSRPTQVAAVPAAARRPAQRRDRRLSVALERAGVRELGLRHGLAQLPRLERLRPGLDRLDHEGLGRPALPGHHQGGRVVQRAAVDRRDRMAAGGGSYGGYLASTDSRPAASVQDAGRARRGVQQLHAVRERRRRDEEALRRILGRPGALQSQLAAPERGEFQDADAGDSRPARPARAGQSRHRAVQHAAEPRRAEQARVLPGRESLGAEAAELAVLVRDQAQVARAVRHARTASPPRVAGGPTSEHDLTTMQVRGRRNEPTRTDEDGHRRCGRAAVARERRSQRDASRSRC